MLLHSASQLLTLTGGPQRGADLGALGLIEDGALLIQGETIAAVGRTRDLLAAHPDEPRLDASGCVVLPGFVDPHTHLVWAGDRAAEFEQKMAGAKYLDILAAGGGILATVRATRAASPEQLLAEARPRLERMFAHGTTTAEAKTGYGLDTETELKLLEALWRLDAEGPLEIVPTFLGAHAVAPEYRDDPQGYTDLICREMLPAVLALSGAPEGCEDEVPLPSARFVSDPRSARASAQRHLPFVDVFCERGAFDLAQSRQILAEAKRLGFPLKIHADEFEDLGGVPLAVELGAVSADHLVKTGADGVAALGKSDTVAVSLPCTPFGLAESEYTPAGEILAAGGTLALATDLNPGTAWNESMQFVTALACRALRLTPAQAIAAATINAAHAIGRASRIGSLEPGKQADLLVLSVPDYRQLGYRFGTNLVRQVVKRGRVYQVGTGYHPA